MQENLKETALHTLRCLLTAVFELKEGEDGDYSVEVSENENGKVLSLDIEANEEPASVLIGKEGITLASLQRVFFSALAFRLGREVNQGVFLTINGRRPILNQKTLAQNGHADNPKVVTIIVPPGVEVHTKTTEQTNLGSQMLQTARAEGFFYTEQKTSETEKSP